MISRCVPINQLEGLNTRSEDSSSDPATSVDSVGSSVSGVSGVRGISRNSVSVFNSILAIFFSRVLTLVIMEGNSRVGDMIRKGILAIDIFYIESCRDIRSPGRPEYSRKFATVGAVVDKVDHHS